MGRKELNQTNKPIERFDFFFVEKVCYGLFLPNENLRKLGQENYNSAQLHVVCAVRKACHFIELSVGLIKLSIELWPV